MIDRLCVVGIRDKRLESAIVLVEVTMAAIFLFFSKGFSWWKIVYVFVYIQICLGRKSKELGLQIIREKPHREHRGKEGGEGFP